MTAKANLSKGSPADIANYAATAIQSVARRRSAAKEMGGMREGVNEATAKSTA